MEGIVVLKGKFESYTVRGLKRSQGRRRIRTSPAGIFYFTMYLGTLSTLSYVSFSLWDADLARGAAVEVVTGSARRGTLPCCREAYSLLSTASTYFRTYVKTS